MERESAFLIEVNSNWLIDNGCNYMPVLTVILLVILTGLVSYLIGYLKGNIKSDKGEDAMEFCESFANLIFEEFPEMDDLQKAEFEEQIALRKLHKLGYVDWDPEARVFYKDYPRHAETKSYIDYLSEAKISTSTDYIDKIEQTQNEN